LIAYFGVKIFRDWSLRRELLDLPNERSSHTTPTPRGGGLIIVIVSLLGYTFLSCFYTQNFRWSYLTGAFLIAAISWLDDLHSISFVWRFLVHSLAAFIAIFNLGFFNEIYIPFLQNINVGAAGAVLTFFWIVWLTNAYNFMDGIDGIAGVQAVAAGIGWLILGKLLGMPTVSVYGAVIAFSSLGFLIHNWQPAKVFMGDVGSAFLGYTFAVLPLLAKNDSHRASEKGFSGDAVVLTIGILLVWFFVFDTLYTFFRRIIRSEKIWLAHREHIYQKLVINGCSHQFVTILYGTNAAIATAFLLFSVEYPIVFDTVLTLVVTVQSLGLLFYYFYLIRKKSLN
jgi:UDP-N-acetylmuramyl pentapeptide phosphotransferase/UDP-N-acetylglucosamine-1-phosphate transferase